MDKPRLSRIERLKNKRKIIVVKPKDGQDGINGRDGLDGLRGEKGESGVTGKMGPVGPKGQVGLRGEKGQPGRDGIDGKGITWTGQWESYREYTVNDGVINFGTAYICILDHKSSPANQPGTGSLRDKYWSILAERGEAGPGGAPGINGTIGHDGATGAAGPGVAAGGTTNQILAKNSNADYDTKWEDAPSGGSTPRATIDFMFNINTTDSATRQFILNSGTGVVTFVSGGYTYSTGGTSGSISRGVINNTLLKIPFLDKNPAIFFGGVALAAEGGDYDLVLYCGGSGGPPATTTSNHFGFRFNRTSGTTTILATNANGTTETTTDITALVSATTTQKSLYAVMTSGTNIKYYYDGTLVATHTTNLPSANPTLVAGQWGIINNAAATSTMQISSVSLNFDLD